MTKITEGRGQIVGEGEGVVGEGKSAKRANIFLAKKVKRKSGKICAYNFFRSFFLRRNIFMESR